MDVWADGSAYETYMGRWSRRVAERFLDWLGEPPGLRWLDVGCGTGALTGAVLDRAEPTQVFGVDPSDRFVAWSAANIGDDRARFAVADAAHLPDVEVDVVVSGLVLNFIPDPLGALGTMMAASPGGTVAAYVWDYADGMDLLRQFWDAAVGLDPSSASLHESERFGWCRPERLAALWMRAGLLDVSTHQIDVLTDFTDFEDYWTPFLSGQGPAPGYVRSLDDRSRESLRETLRRRLPLGPDGTLSLQARAWAVRGRVR
jgi:SAM-dependent methyltransferase